MNPKVSIIIPVRTITNYLIESFSYLKKLKYDNFEVLIFTDEKESYEGLPENFKIIKAGKIGPAEKRNLPLKYASGEILAFLDDDAFPRSDWLKNAVKNFEDENICGVGGPSMTPINEDFLEKASGEVLSSALTSGGTTHRHQPESRRFVDDYPTVNLLVKFSDFKKIGGFDKEFWPGEDTKLCLDLIKKTGKKIVYDPSVIVYHHRRRVFKPHLKQLSRYGMHRGQFARVFPENSRKPMYFIPSLFVLGLVLGPITFLFSNFLSKVYLATILLYILLVLIESVKVYVKNKSLRMALYFSAGVFLSHVVYGSYFLYGLFVRPKLKLKKVDLNKKSYSEG